MIGHILTLLGTMKLQNKKLKRQAGGGKAMSEMGRFSDMLCLDPIIMRQLRVFIVCLHI